jgi:catechol 2,3-dioxygenase-like lactoylglutathione lyase family enzyme
MRIGSIVIQCYEFDKMLDFWQKALDYHPREPAHEGWVVLCDPGGGGPNLSLNKVNARRTGKRSRLHLDLYTSDQVGEVKRLLSIGARSYNWEYPKDADYVVMQDPDGNLFCIVQKSGI